MHMERISFEGWDNCIRLTNGDAELIILTAVGPRIISYTVGGGPNAFQVIPASKGLTGGEEWRPYGGHRLWHAPEVKPRSYVPDNGTVEAVLDGERLILTSPTEPGTGIQKQTQVTLALHGAAVKVEHRLTNHGHWAVEIAPWALTIVANGGKVVLPQEPFVSHDDELAPSRPLVVWPFTEMADPRWRWGTKYLSLSQEETVGKPQKVGVYNSLGWAAHLTPTQAFITQIEVDENGPDVLPDMGSNFETYTDGPFQELETLGPLEWVEPGEAATHLEYWYLAPLTAAIADDDASLDAQLLPLVARAQAERVR